MGKIIQSYALQQIIGQGMYGKVYKAMHLRTKQQFAVKVIPITKFQQNPKLQECTVNQINILSKIEQNQHIIRYVEMLKTPNNFYFIYEFCNGKTLENILRHEGHLSEARALKVFKQLLEAFKVLNKYNIMHRDLKPDNIFFHNGCLKLGDFGFCKTLGKSSDMASTMLGSPIYMGPEVLKGEIYTSKADIWSLGVVLFEMLFGFCPFQSNSIAKLISVLEGTQLNIPLQINPISQPTQLLLKRLLVKDQFKRIDWFELLQIDISESGVINEKRSSDAKLEELKEILSQKSIGVVGGYGMTESLPDNFKSTEVSSNSSGSKMAGSFSRNQVKVEGFDEKAQINMLANNYLEPKRANTYEQPKRTYEQSLKVIEQVRRSMDSTGLTSAQTPSSSSPYSTPSILRKNSLPTTSYPHKRKHLLQQHSHCMLGVRLAISLLKSDQLNGVAISYIIFIKIEQRLHKILSAITSSDIDIEDISVTISNELKAVEKQLNELREELAASKLDTGQLSDPRGYLRNRFKERSDHNVKLWHEMVQFVKGERVLTSDASPMELTIMINSALM